MTTSSAFRSSSSSFLPFSITSGCLRTSSQPMWEKKKPRVALWGSASVSEYLWWTRWSLAHSYMSFCRQHRRDYYYYIKKTNKKKTKHCPEMWCARWFQIIRLRSGAMCSQDNENAHLEKQLRPSNVNRSVDTRRKLKCKSRNAKHTHWIWALNLPCRFVLKHLIVLSSNFLFLFEALTRLLHFQPFVISFLVSISIWLMKYF